MNKRMYIVLVIAVISFGLLLTGGTYAFLTFSNVTINGQANGTSTCFLIDYETGSALSGTLFQSKTHFGGLSGSVSMRINTSCSVPKGIGTLKLHVNSESSDILFSESALKYAVSPNAGGEPVVSSGVINAENTDITLYTGFNVLALPVTQYVFVWLDGEIADDAYTNVTFSGYITASAVQSE